MELLLLAALIVIVATLRAACAAAIRAREVSPKHCHHNCCQEGDSR